MGEAAPPLSTSVSPPHLVVPSKSSSTVRFLRPPLFSVVVPHRIPAACSAANQPSCPVLSEGPSCIFVGPIESASQETLEALYRQARDAYYSGKPLIVDDMFDRVEEDPSQVFALASVWFLILVFGGSVCLLPILYTVNQAYQETFNSSPAYVSQSPAMHIFVILNCALFMLLGSVIGCPIAIASARALNGLWRSDLVALKGACPNCGEEVFAFVRSDQSNSSPHRGRCHVCECLLEFRTTSEKSLSSLGRRWVHGRIYLISDRNRRRQVRT
ncbi:uncharacterized protein LOC141643689 isoform X3 [Silene latifolia]|uniref:uncharacterized protein LOC141643689 isoform X3 n=1 Tax=Silene latifolia TaxID=37657 RepID=UPI003D7736DC